LFAPLVLLIAAAKKPIKTGDISGYVTKLYQSILETFDIYAACTLKAQSRQVSSISSLPRQDNQAQSMCSLYLPIVLLPQLTEVKFTTRMTVRVINQSSY
jgi:hypothetical protein